MAGRRFRPALEELENRTMLSAWGNFAHDPQHTGVSPASSQPLDAIHWQTPIDLNPTGAAVHYGSPVITALNTVIVPVKAGANGGFELNAFSGASGLRVWTLATDYTLPPFGWMPPLGPALTPANRLYFAGDGGTVYYVNNPDSRAATISGQLAFYGINNYRANPGAYNSAVMIDTPITADNAGNIYFGFEVTGPNPSGLTGGGIARIDASGNGSYVVASTAANDAAITKVALAAAPALSNDGSILYVSVNESGNYYGYVLGLDSTTLATRYQVFLKDPRNHNANNAGLLDVSTATPMVAPDGSVFYGVFGNPYNGSRGFLLHFSADLATEYIPGAFGWDDTASIVPTSMVPSYHGTAPYLIFSKYNNYVAGETGSSGGDGVNRVAILDPFARQADPNNDGDSGLQVMREVLTMPGPTPDTYWVNQGYANARREWCINDTVVDPYTRSILVNSEDGMVYRWNLISNTLTQAVTVSTGVGEPYTPTLIGPDHTVYAINGGSLFALGGLTHMTLTNVSSQNPAALGQAVTFTTTVASTNRGAVPTGTITYQDGSATLATMTLTSGQAAYSTSSLSLGNHFITAVYSGDSNYAPGSTTLVESVLYGSTVAVSSSLNPSVFGQPVTVTATLSPAPPGTATPTGRVVFLDGSRYLGTVDLSNGQASFTVANLGAGTHTIHVNYGGDLFYAPSSGTLTQSVRSAATTTALASSANPSTFGQPVTFTATVAVIGPGAGVPTGSVQFADGAIILGTVPLSAGQATFTTSTLSLGIHSMRALYVHSSNYSSSTSPVLVQTVGSVYYVAPAGSDFNLGTLGAPFLTINHGVSVLHPGDTLYIRGGTYAESLIDVIPSGTSWPARVAIAAYPGERVTIQPPFGQDFAVRIRGSNTAYVELDNLILDGQNLNSTAVYIAATSAGSPNHIRLQGCEIKNVNAGQGIELEDAGGVVSDCEILRSTIHDIGTTNMMHGMYIQGSHNLMDGDTLYNIYGLGIQIHKEGGVNGRDASFNIVRDCLIHNCGLAGNRPSLGLFVGDGNQAYNNVIYAGYAGIVSDGGATNTLICNNTVYGCSTDGIRTGYDDPVSTGILVENNISFGNGLWDIRDYGTNTTIQYNLTGQASIGNFGTGATIATNVLSSNPLFVDAAAANFHLQAGSPAIDAGITLALIATDFDGVTRPQGRGYDIGAFEYH
jgi:Bacterial Ig-like domain (group 3)/Right handed beta helix region